MDLTESRTSGPSPPIDMYKNLCILLLIGIPLTRSLGQEYKSEEFVNEMVCLQTAQDYAVSGSKLPFSLSVFDKNEKRPTTLSKVAYVQLFNAKGQEIFKTSVSLTKGFGAGYIELQDTLTSGIYQITGYTQWMRNFGTSIFAHQFISVVNPREKPEEIPFCDPARLVGNSLELNLSSSKINARSSGVLSIRSQEKANVSVSVYRVDSVVRPSLFSSDTPVFPETFSLTYLPEYEGKRIEGKLMQLSTKNALPHEDISVSIPEKPVRYFYVQTDSTGRFEIEIPNFRGEHELFFSVNRKDAVIELKDPFEQKLSISKRSPFSSKGLTDSSDLALYHLSTQLSKTFNRDSTAETPNDNLPFYNSASIRYDLDNYVRFPTIEDIFREFVSEVYVRKEASETKIQVKELSTDIPFPGRPLILFDGVPINSYESLLAYNPKDIKYLDVLREPYYHHKQVYNGLIAFYSKTGNLPDFKLDQSVSILDVNGTQKPVHLSKLKLSDSRFPDFRTRLLWLPTVDLKPAIETKIMFHTSEVTGRFVVEVKGFDSLQNPVMSRSFFVIVK